jgi:hypothetical protein
LFLQIVSALIFLHWEADPKTYPIFQKKNLSVYSHNNQLKCKKLVGGAGELDFILSSV